MEDYVEWAQTTVISSWNYLSADSANLQALPTNLHDSLRDFINKITRNGTLPTLPEWKDLPNNWQPPPPPPPRSVIQRLGDSARGHPYLIALFLTSGSLGGTYYFFPKAFTKQVVPIFRPLKQLVPVALLPESDRPRRISGPQGDVRKEVALVLGAEGLGRDVALDLESRGFVVIATVRLASEVDILEKRSRGWMKVLVLDPEESSSVGPFLRSLSTALSLRFPLHTSGDPFARPAHALALTSVVNCLSLDSSSEPLCPVEGINPDQARILGERVATVIGVLRGVMPTIRTMASRPHAPEAVIVSLIPSTNSNFSLPFLSLSSATDSAIVSLLHSLRRELAASRTSNIRITILETGFFDLPQPAASSAPSSSGSPPPSPGFAASYASDPLTPRLSSIYSSALERRKFVRRSPTSGETRGGRKGSQVRKLNKKVFEILVHGRGGRTSRVGAGASTYHFVSYLPHFVTDAFLSLQDRLVGVLLSHRPALHLTDELPPLSSDDANAQSLYTSTNLATPRPGPARTLPTSSTASASGQSSDKMDSGEESGSEGGSKSESVGSGYETGSGMGSFVGSEAGWREEQQ